MKRRTSLIIDETIHSIAREIGTCPANVPLMSRVPLVIKNQPGRGFAACWLIIMACPAA